jgi:hypothetical protein
MTRVLRLPPRGRSGTWLVALGIGLVMAIQPIWKDNYAIGVTGLIALTLIACARWQLRWVPVLVVILCGVMLRWSVSNNHASDVSDVTRAAIMVMTHGANLFWYLPFLQDPTQVEMLVTFALLGYFGIRAGTGRPIGLVIFALAPPLILASVDGSNDTSAGLFILVALALAAKRPALGAGVLGIAVAFKPYALAWLPPLALWAGLPAIFGFLAASFVAWSPVLLVWGADSYLKSLAMAQQTHLREAYWSLASVWDGIDPGSAPRALETIRYVASGAVAVIGGLRVRSIDGVIVVGAVAFMIAQFAGYFGSYVYVAAVAPVICSRVDDWLRHLLPELTHAYGEAPALGRRIRRATAPSPLASPLPSPLRVAESTAPPRLAGAMHAVPRGRGTRPSRTPTS